METDSSSGAHGLLRAARRALGRLEGVELCRRQAGRAAELVARRLGAVRLQVLASRAPDPREVAHGAIRQGDGPRQLRDELLHRLADPERRVRPERRLEPGVVAARGEEQTGDAFLEELAVLEPAAPEAARHAGDRGEEGFDEPAARVGVAALGCDDQIAFLRNGEALPSQWASGRWTLHS